MRSPHTSALKRAALGAAAALPPASAYAGRLDPLLDFLASEAGGLAVMGLSLLALGLACRRVARRWSAYSRTSRLLAGGACVAWGAWCLGLTVWEGGGRALPPELAQRRAEWLLTRGCERMGLRWMEQAAEGERLEAQAYLAKTYRSGQVRHDGALVAAVPEDERAAARWYRRVAEGLRGQAEAGVADAQVQLGMLYLMGQGVRRSEAQAVRLFAHAAAQEHPQGHLWYGWALMQSDPDAAQAHLERAAALGEREAYPLIVTLCSLPRPAPDLPCRTETLRRWAAAGDSAGVAAFGQHVRALRRAAARGNPDAEAELGAIKEKGPLPTRL